MDKKVFFIILDIIFQEFRPSAQDIGPGLLMSHRRADSGPTFSTLIDGTVARRQRGNFRRHKSSLRRGRPFPKRRGNNIPGSPGTDFPDLTSIPLTRFSCLDGGADPSGNRKPGFYADVETQCQVSSIFFSSSETSMCKV